MLIDHIDWHAQGAQEDVDRFIEKNGSLEANVCTSKCNVCKRRADPFEEDQEIMFVITTRGNLIWWHKQCKSRGHYYQIEEEHHENIV